MATPLELLDLAICQAEEAAGEGQTLERAAEIVEDFSTEHGLAALDAVLDAANRDEPADLEAIRSLARDATRQTDLLQAEIKRFLTLDRAK
jgi:hypothetical protein